MYMFFKGQLVVIALGAWALLALSLLTLFGSLDHAFYFAVSFLGFLVIAALFSPYVVRPRWKSRLDLAGIAGALAFGVIVVQKAMVFWEP